MVNGTPLSDHAREMRDVHRWHLLAPLEKVMVCGFCHLPRTFLKSLWKCGRYSCEVCGYHLDERWRSIP